MIKKRVLVTGGAWIYWKPLVVKELVKSDRNIVYSLDNYFTGSEDDHIEGVTYIKGDTKDIDTLNRFSPPDFRYILFKRHTIARGRAIHLMASSQERVGSSY